MQGQDQVQDFALLLLKRLGRATWKWLLGVFGWWLLLVIPVMMAAAWLMGGGRSQAASDPIGQLAFPGDWLERAERAANASVDSAKPDQLPFKLTVQDIGSLRLLDYKTDPTRYDPDRIAAALEPLFEYKTYPTTTTSTWQECPTNAGATTNDGAPGASPADGNAETAEGTVGTIGTCTSHKDTVNGEVNLLVQVHQLDGVTNFTYKTETVTGKDGDRTITETRPVLDQQSFQADLSRLTEALERFGFTPPEKFVEDYMFYRNNASTDPLKGDPWQGGGGWEMPGQAYTGTRDPGLPKDGWFWPAPGSRAITDPFGWRIHPIRGTRNFHTGVDIGAPMGSPAIAVRNGIVTFAQYGWNAGYGNRIMVSLDNGAVATYNHLERFEVKEGDVVTAGQEIAITGTTGNSTGPHLHFEILVGGEAIDPLLYIPK